MAAIGEAVFPAEGSFLGEPPFIRDRIILKMSDWKKSQTVAFTPTRLLNLEVSETHPKPRRERVEKITIYAPITLTLIVELSDANKDHLETRLQNDWRLFVEVYKTWLVYSMHKTLHQVGQALDSDAEYAGAHACTFPNLICRRRQEDSGHMFAYGSSAYLNRNATTILPVANKVDTAMELTQRPYGIEMLNMLSYGKRMAPKAAYLEYLNTMRFRLETLYKENSDGSWHRVINDYLSVLSYYITYFSEASDSVVHKLTFTYKTKPVVNDRFYQMVQSEMHKVTHVEMLKLEVEYKQRLNDDTLITGAALGYLQSCLKSYDVQINVRDYFENASDEVQEEDMKQARDVRLSVCKVRDGKVTFSKEMRDIFDTCIKAIRVFGKNLGICPRDLSILFPRILRDINETSMPDEVYLFPPPPARVTTRSQTTAGLSLQIPEDEQKSTTESGTILTLTQKAHLKLCVDSPAVKQIAERYFLNTPQGTQTFDMAKARDKKLKVSTAPKHGFSPTMLELFNKCLEVIRSQSTTPSAKKKAQKADAKKKYNPKNIHFFFPRVIESLKT